MARSEHRQTIAEGKGTQTWEEKGALVQWMHSPGAALFWEVPWMWAVSLSGGCQLALTSPAACAALCETSLVSP